MQLKSLSVGALLLATIITSCGGSANQEAANSGSFCKDSACMSEPLQFNDPAPSKNAVSVSFKDCKIDSIHWNNGIIIFNEFIPNEVRPSKSYFACEFSGAKYAWLKFNDCSTGRGFLIKVPFDKKETPQKITSAINDFDPKFNVEKGLIAYYDNTFIYVQDILSGKEAKTLLTDTGVKGIDYYDVHSLIDSVHITKDNLYAKLIIDGKPVEQNKPIQFK